MILTGYKVYLTPKSNSLSTGNGQIISVFEFYPDNAPHVSEPIDISINIVSGDLINSNDLPRNGSDILDLCSIWVNRLNNYFIETGVFGWVIASPQFDPDGNASIELACGDNHFIYLKRELNRGGVINAIENSFTLKTVLASAGIVNSTPIPATSDFMNNVKHALFNFDDLGQPLITLAKQNPDFNNDLGVSFFDYNTDIYNPVMRDLMIYNQDSELFYYPNMTAYLQRSSTFDRLADDTNYFLYYGYPWFRSTDVGGGYSSGAYIFRAVLNISNVYKWDVASILTANTGTFIESISINRYQDNQSVEVDVILNYSIDGVTWYDWFKDINLQPNTSYTLYVKDQFNAVVTKDFYTEVAETYKLAEPFFKIENANSLKFYEVNGAAKFFDNSLFVCQDYFNVEKQCYKQRVKQSNSITTQVKTSYETITANILDSDGVIVKTPTVEMKVQNTLLTDKRDCMIKAVEGMAYVYFAGGNIYDPATSSVINTYYDSKYLPSFCSEGMIINLTGAINGGFEVLSIDWIADMGRYVLAIAYTSSELGDYAGICLSNYNLEDYDIWEFTTVFASLPTGVYTIEVSGTDADPRYSPVLWKSEPIHVKSDWAKHLELTYTNDDNINQMDYSTGIINILNIPARFVRWSVKGNTERFSADDGASYTLKSLKTRIVSLETAFIPQYLAEKLVIAGDHNEIKINGYDCQLVDDVEIEDNLDKQNPFYKITMKMQMNESIDLSDRMGVTSAEASVLGANSDEVLGL